LTNQGVPVAAHSKTDGLHRKPYQKPELLRWGSLLDLTRGALSNNTDADEFGGSRGV
jgi:hypothetical protein